MGDQISTAFSLRRIKVLAGAVVLIFIATGIEVVSPFNNSVAATMNSNLITGSSAAEVSRIVSDIGFPSGSARVVMTSSSPIEVVTQAAAYASSRNLPLVVSESSSNATNALADTDRLAADEVILFGDTKSFSAGFKRSVYAEKSVPTEAISDRPFERSKAAPAALEMAQPMVIARIERHIDLRIAAALAIRSSDSLILVDGTETSEELTNFFAEYKDVPVTVVGGTNVLMPGVIAEDQLPQFFPCQ